MDRERARGAATTGFGLRVVQQAVLDRRSTALLQSLSPLYAQAIYDVIHRESVRRQSEIMNAEPAMGAAEDGS